MSRTWPKYRTTNRGANKQREKIIQLAVKRWMGDELPHVVDYFNDWAAGKYFENPALAKERAAFSSGRGWADLFIPYPMTHTLADGTERRYNGLFLEIKKEGVSIYCKIGPRKGELVSDEQIEIEAAFLNRMSGLGYAAKFGVGYEGCLKVLRWYFQIPEQTELF